MPFVLVHGAGMGASCWAPLIPELSDRSIALDLPGRGKRSHDDLRTVSLDDCATAIVNDVEADDLNDIVLVAHSFAGVSVPRTLVRLADRIKHVVFLSAVVPQDGTRVIDQIDPSVRDAVEQSIDGGVYRQDRDGAIVMLCNDMTDQQTRWTLDQVTDDAAALLSEPVDLAGLAAEVPRTYIRLSNDMCYPPDLQERSAQIVGGSTTTIDSGHMAMVSHPVELAGVLNALA